MATRADMMLLQAMTQLGAGLGSHMNRRRQGKRDEEFANQFAPMTDPEQFMDPQDSKLIQALSGGVPGMAGAVSGAGMQAQQMLGAKAKSGQANQKAGLMRSALQDPRVAAMAKQSMLAASMPKDPKVIPTTGGTFIQRGQDLEWVAAPEKKLKPGEQFKEFGSNLYDVSVLDKDGRPKLLHEGVQGTKYLEVGYGDPKDQLKVKMAMNPDGTPGQIVGEPYGYGKSEVTTIEGGQPPLTTPVKGRFQLDKAKIDKSLENFYESATALDTKFLTREDKAWRGLQEQVDKSQALSFLFGDLITDESWDNFDKATDFKTSVWRSVNAHIKEITGAQMSYQEVPRLMNEIANMSDSPRQYMRKMGYMIKMAERARGRINDYLENDTVAPGGRSVYNKWIADGASHEEARLQAAQASVMRELEGELQALQYGGPPADYSKTPAMPAASTESSSDDIPSNWEQK